MSDGQVFFPLRGGLDQETPAIAIPPGRVIACLNHEMQPAGAQRTEGYERFDGQLAPSDADFYTLTFSEGALAFSAGDTIIGNNSGATARILDAAALASGSFTDGDAAGTLAVHLVSGTFTDGELLLVGVTIHARLTTAPTLGDFRESANALAWLLASQAYRRDLIAAVPGSGAVRGVLYLADQLHAWRDNADATQGILYHSSDAGWAATDLARYVMFTDGGPYKPSVGDVLTGDESAATATLLYAGVDGGDWAFSSAAGVFVLGSITGTIGDETVTTGSNDAFATLVGSPVPMSFPAGGRYEFEVFNFYATEGFERAYGANGVGKAFEFNGSYCAPITTGMAADTPFLVREHKNHLFFAFPYGSLQHSVLGEPRNFSGILGAAELGMGHEITNLIPNTAAVMLIFTSQSLSTLTGNDSSDWSLEPQSEKDAGATAFTAQRIGDVIYLDHRGVRSAASTATYGNFKLGTFTTLINRELNRKRKAGVNPVASCVVKTKSQYLLFFDDGSGVSIFFGLKQPEPMLFQYPFTVSCLHLAEIDGVERIFAGATDGFVYELNKGTSFDGAEIEAFLQLPFGHQGDPRLNKRYKGLELEMTAAFGTEVGLIPQFDFGGAEQPLTHQDDLTIEGGGGLWGIATWDDFVWGAPINGSAHFYIDGSGANMSPIFVSRQATVPSYTMSGVTVVFRGRGRKR